MKVALLFPGQGAQYVGMGKELYDHYTDTKQIFDQAATLLDWNVKEVCFEDFHALIHQTRYTQAALFTTNYGIYEALKAEGIRAEAVLGFSLGEYDALVASEVLTFEEALKLVDQRASFMEVCANQYPGGMSAVIGISTEQIEKICQQVSETLGSSVTVANDNCQGQVTIAGTKAALEAASIALKEAGARRVLPLKVSGAFHSPLMKESAKRLEQVIEPIDFRAPQIPIVSNVTAQFMTQEEIKKNVPLQIVQGVRFRESILYLIEKGFDTFIEVGPKTTLSGLVQKISKEVTVYHVEDLATLKITREKVGGLHA